MSNGFIASQEEVSVFLQELFSILSDSNFYIKTDLDILMKHNPDYPKDPCTTLNTMLALGFDAQDICDQLLSLQVKDYIETLTDNKDQNLPPLFVFMKIIQQREVYIKIKIRHLKKKQVFCISFHFAKYPLSGSLPYA